MSTRRGPFTQVSRLGNPLFNEVIVPMSQKDRWNRLAPCQDSQFAKYVAQPELARLLPVLYPGCLPESGGADGGPRGSAGHPADRHSDRG